MAIPLTGTDDALFPRLGRLGHALSLLQAAQAGTLATVNDLLGRYGPPDEDLTATLALARDSLIRGVPAAAYAQAATLAQSTLLRMVAADQPTRAGSLSAALAELVRQMEAAGESVPACSVAATPAAYAGNTGTGAVVVAAARGDGRTQENAAPEPARLDCTTDSRTGGRLSGIELFTYAGVPDASRPADWDWPQGSGASATVTAATAVRDYPAGSNLLVNGGWDDWGAGNTTLQRWTVTGTATRETSLRYGSGAAAVRVAAGNTASLTQQLNNSAAGSGYAPSPLSSVAFALWVRGSAALSGGNLRVGLWNGSAWVQDAQGNDSYVDFPLAGLGTTFTAKSGVVRWPAVLGATYFRVQVTSTPVGGALVLDHLAAANPTAAYAGGPGLAVFSGDVPWLAGDGWAVAVSNDRAGAAFGATWQTLFDRLFGMRSLGLLLPSSGAPTVPDSLISAPAGGVGALDFSDPGQSGWLAGV